MLKAFDFLEWDHIWRCLKYYKFGPKIIKLIKILYRDISSCTINNGHISEFFKVSRGVRQGCPLSPYLFILCVEPLAEKIRTTDTIHGIQINNVEHKISQYADDTSLFLAGDIVSFIETFKIFEKYKSLSGLSVNRDKTQVMPLYKHRRIKDEIVSLGLNWTNGPVSLLGVSLFSDTEQITKFNYELKLNKIKNVVTSWSKRIITPFGKVIVIKSLILSQLIYLLSVLPNPTKKFFKEVEVIVFNYLWDNKPDKLKRTHTYAPKCVGGLGMLHLQSQAKALKLGCLETICY